MTRTFVYYYGADFGRRKGKFSTMLDRLNGHVVDAALAVLGARLLRPDLGLEAEIVEVEAYRGASDPGSHAFRGPTPRNRTMFGLPGYAYVYFTYGMHWMLNVSAEPAGTPGAVLIRAARPLRGLDTFRAHRPKAQRDRELLGGPAMLTAAFGITRIHDGNDLFSPSSSLQLVLRDQPLDLGSIRFGPRIGIAQGRGDETPWRFVWADYAEWSSGRPSKLQDLTDPRALLEWG